MKKILITIADYPDHRQQIFENHFAPKTRQYCDKWGYEYRVYKIPDLQGRKNPIWGKLLLARQIMKEENPDVLTVMDADMTFAKIDKEMISDKDFYYNIDSGNTHCMGNYVMRNTWWTKKLLEDLLSEHSYKEHKNKELWSRWAEQAAIYYLFGVPDHSDVSFLLLKHFGWNSETRPGVPTYNLDELYEHVEVGGPEWNCTLMEPGIEECPISSSLLQYNINKINQEDIRIRHVAAGQPWENGIYYSNK